MQLSIDSLRHDYKNGKHIKHAIKSLSLTVEPGILGLLGPNGAGKSSLMRILATITKPSGGRVLWNGTDIVKSPRTLRTELGYLPQYFGVYEQLSSVEFLHYIASLKGIDKHTATLRIDELLDKLNLAHVGHTPLSGYSGGMRQRIGIAQALLNDPKLLIIDEPTVGLDPQERNNFRQLLTELAHERCIIFSTHIVSDIESIADRIAIMRDGELLKADVPQAIQNLVADKCWLVDTSANELAHFQQMGIVSHSVRKDDGLVLSMVSDMRPNEQAQARVPTLEDAYLYLTAGNTQHSLSKVA